MSARSHSDLSIQVAPPGSLTPNDDARPTTIQLVRYNSATFTVDLSRDDLPERLVEREPNLVRWVHVEGTAHTKALEALGTCLGLHRLALEDSIHGGQRPKLEDYESHAFLVLFVPHEETGLEQVGIFLGEGFVVTISEHSATWSKLILDRLRRGKAKARHSGADYLCYVIIDTIIDHYFPLVEELSGRLEALEDRLVAGDDDGTVAEVHEVRQELYTLRRRLLPTREAITLLRKGDIELIGESVRPFLRDCRDHAAQLLDGVDTCRDLSSNLMELEISLTSRRLNETMRVLALISTVFIPMSFVASVYGMNFDVKASDLNMPELGWAFGYPFALSLMVLSGCATFLYFRSSRWRTRLKHKPSLAPPNR